MRRPFGALAAAALVSSSLIALAVAAQPVHATDLPVEMPVKAPVVAPAPLFDWTGFYVGGHVGYGWADHSFTTSFGDAATAAHWGIVTALEAYNIAPNFDSEGWLAGFQFGYNYQVDRHVFGIEADISWTDINGSQTTSIDAACCVPSTTVATSDLDWFGTLRGRLGFLPTDRLLVYATGGLAVGRTKYSYHIASAQNFVDGAGSKTKWGWTIGGGAELALWDNWTAKLEYLYYDLGNTRFQTVGSGFSAGLGTFNVKADNAGHIVRAGLNYRFGYAPPPVTAGY